MIPANDLWVVASAMRHELKKDRFSLLNKGKPLTVKADDIDWENYRK